MDFSMHKRITSPVEEELLWCSSRPMEEVAGALYRELPYDTFREIYRNTIRLLFDELEILCEYMHPECVLNENVQLHDVFVYQNGDHLKFERDRGERVLILKDATDLIRILKKGILRFRSLKVEFPTDDTETMMEYSEFVYQFGSIGKSLECLERSDVLEVNYCTFTELETLAKSLKRPKIIINYTQFPAEGLDSLRQIWEELVVPHENLYLRLLRLFIVGDNVMRNFDEAVEEYHRFLEIGHSRFYVNATVVLYVSEETGEEQARIGERMVERIGCDKIQTLVVDGPSKNVVEVPFTVASKLSNLEVLSVKCRFRTDFNTLGDLRDTKVKQVTLGYDTYSEKWLHHGLPKSASVSFFQL